MPLYDFKCEKCGVFEIQQKMADPALEVCPSCSRPVTKLIGKTSFTLKGSGWYRDGYGNPAPKVDPGT